MNITYNLVLILVLLNSVLAVLDFEVIQNNQNKVAKISKRNTDNELKCGQYILKDDVDFTTIIFNKSDAQIYANIVRCNANDLPKILDLADSLDQVHAMFLYNELFSFLKNHSLYNIDVYMQLVTRISKFGECIQLKDTILDYIVKRTVEIIADDARNYTLEFDSNVMTKIYDFNNENGLKLMSEVVEKLYDKNDLQSLITFVNEHEKKSQVLKGLETILEQMIIKGDLGNPNLFYLASMIRVASKDESINEESKRRITNLKNKLPKSIRNAAFYGEVYIRNEQADRYLTSPNINTKTPLTVGNTGNYNADQWKFEVRNDGDFVVLKSKYTEYPIKKFRENWWMFGKLAFELGLDSDFDGGLKLLLIEEDGRFYIKSKNEDLYMQIAPGENRVYMYREKNKYAVWSVEERTR